MKTARRHRPTRRGSCKSALAASFVVTFATHGTAGCKKQTVDTPEPAGARTWSSTVSRSPFGDCHLFENAPCPKDVHCNPPPPLVIDCPPDMGGDAGAPAVTRRPPGKEDWVRVKPRLFASNTACTFQPEYFCAPPGKPWECTPRPTAVTVPCTTNDAGTRQVESFVYKDGLGVCRKVPATECGPGPRGSCDELPEGEIVPCP